jgi:hypothetical protein
MFLFSLWIVYHLILPLKSKAVVSTDENSLISWFMLVSINLELRSGPPPAPLFTAHI